MLKKTYAKDGSTCKVTFTLPPETNAQAAALYGDFTDWGKKPKAMKKGTDGSFSASVSLEPGHQYRFRYLLDESRWENDWAADAYAPNTFGTDDSIVKV
jgi:1,4-alpha-glucan branching enzyme